MYSIFVSSTFKDMQFERDYIKNVLSPRLNTFLSPYGESVNFGDLRWGVNTSGLDEEEANKKVLRICLDEIDNDRRYFIVFIGERYGWIPPEDLMLETMKNKGIDHLDVDISVTNLEIEYGVFSDKKTTPLFFFRKLDTSKMSLEEKKIFESEDDIHRQKLEVLKKKIRDRYGDVVFEYSPKWDEDKKTITGLEEVMDILYEKLSSHLDKELKEYNSLKKYQKAIKASDAYFSSLAKDTYRRSDKSYKVPEITSKEDYYHSNYEDLPVIFYASSTREGVGRKTYVASLYKQSLLDERYITVPFAFGINENTDDSFEFVNLIYGVINEALGKGQKDFDDDNTNILKATFEAIKELNKSDKYIRIFISNATHDILQLLKFIEAEVDVTHITFIIQDESIPYLVDTLFPYPYYNHQLYFNIFPLENIDDKVGVILSIASRKHKELSTRVIDEILKKDSSDLPLYLSLIVERLLYLNNDDFKNIRNLGDGMEAIDNYMCQVVQESSDDVKGIAKELLKDLINKINKSMLLTFIKLMTYDFRLSVYPKGEQSISEMELLFKYLNKKWNKIDYLLFIHSIPSLFLESSINDGVVKFKSEDITDAAKEICDEYGVEELYDDVVNFIVKSDLYTEKEKIFKALEIYSEYEDEENFALYYLKLCQMISNHKASEEIFKMFNLIDIKMREGNRFYIDVMRKIIDILNEKEGDEYLCNYVGYFYLPFIHISRNVDANTFAKQFGGEIFTYAFANYLENENNPYLKGIVTLYYSFMKDHLDNDDYVDEVEAIEEYIEDNDLADEFIGFYNDLCSIDQGPLNLFINAYDEFGDGFGELIYYGDDEEIKQFIEDNGVTVLQYFDDKIINQPLLKDAIDESVKIEEVKQFAHGQLVILSAMRFFLEALAIHKEPEKYFNIFNRLLTIYLSRYVFTAQIGGNYDQIRSLKQIAYFLVGLYDYDFSKYPYISSGLEKTIELFTDVCRQYLSIYDDDVVLMTPYIKLVSEVVKDKRKDFLFITPLVINSFNHGFDNRLLVNYFILFDEVKFDIYFDNDKANAELIDMFKEISIALYLYNEDEHYTNLVDVVIDYLKFASPYKVYEDYEVKESKQKDTFVKDIYQEIIKPFFKKVSYKKFLEDLGE